MWVWLDGFYWLNAIRRPVSDTVPVSALAFEALWTQWLPSEVKSDPYSDVKEYSIFITGCSVSLWATLHIWFCWGRGIIWPVEFVNSWSHALFIHHSENISWMLSAHKYACDRLAVIATRLKSRVVPYINPALTLLYLQLYSNLNWKQFLKIYTGIRNYRSLVVIPWTIQHNKHNSYLHSTYTV